MISLIKTFQNIFNSHRIVFFKKSINEIILKFTCYLIINSINNINEIEKSSNKSKNIVIDRVNEDNSHFYVICFDQTIIIISENQISLLSNFFKQNKSKIIITSENVKEALSLAIFENNFLDKLFEFDDYFNKDAISIISKNFTPKSPNDEDFIKVWSLILPSFSKFFLNTIYTKHLHNKYEELKPDFYELTEDEIIILQNVGKTCSSRVELIYHIKMERLFVIKFFESKTESTKLFTREFTNLKKINHPSFPHFYGKGKIDDTMCLIIEFIRGKSLCQIDKMSLTIEDKINFILEIMNIIEYFKINNLIYRDLKPSNFIVDEYKRLILIDFDRMIGIDEQKPDNATMDFGNIYQAPELLDGSLKKYSYKEDIYSFGLLFYFILFEKDLHLIIDEKTNKIIYQFDEILPVFFKLHQIFKNCISKEPEKRPTITEIVDYFYNDFIPSIQNQITMFDLTEVIQKFNIKHFFPYWSLFYIYDNPNFKRQLEIFYEQETIYFNAKEYIRQYSLVLNLNHMLCQFSEIACYNDNYINDNVNKFIHYFTISSNNNNPLAQFYLGLIYSEISTTRDIDKAIHYYKLAASQNHIIAQNNLGLIFYEEKYIPRDINKAIHYFTLAANQNFLNAQYNLGFIFSDDKSIAFNINKAIHFYTLAANQNHAASQSDLGLIYYEGKYVTRNMDKAIHYLALAANQNLENAQYNLGILYTEGKYILRDIDKGIYYLKLAADNNQPHAQNFLGFIYSEGNYVPVDIKKAIHYYTLAANQNHVIALNNLGIIYSQNKYVLIDIEKAIYYFTLAAKQNHANSQYNLGLIYFHNIYVPQDIKRAIYYLTLSADQNYADAQNTLGLIYVNGNHITRDIKKGIYYLKLAADQNHSDAQNNLGFIYYDRKYLSHDIKKAIYYFTLAVKQNNAIAQNNLGYIYFEGISVPRDINKAIYYFTLAANQNHVIAQNNLGYIFSEGKYTSRDIKKAIYYFTLAANQNYAIAQNNLGYIYFEGISVPRDINKAIYYFTLAANQNHVGAQFSLGFIYLLSKYGSQDMNKAIYYLSLAANQNHADSQYLLGFIYFNPLYFHQNVKKGLNYIKIASMNGYIYAHFHVGFLYHEGKYEKQDIKKAIHFYKEGSSFNNQYAKNNLGIIYKNGFNNEITPNLGLAITYFEEAIKQEDAVSMFNLASIYIYNEFNQKLNEAIDLLIKSSNLGFKQSDDLFGIAVIKKAGFNISNIRKEMHKHKNITKSLKEKIYSMIHNEKTFYLEMHFNDNFNFYRNIDYLYDFSLYFIKSNQLNAQTTKNSQHSTTMTSISSEFYKGFGIYDLKRYSEDIL